MALPENKGMTYQGRPVEELSKDELLELLYHAKALADRTWEHLEENVRISAARRELA